MANGESSPNVVQQYPVVAATAAAGVVNGLAVTALHPLLPAESLASMGVLVQASASLIATRWTKSKAHAEVEVAEAKQEVPPGYVPVEQLQQVQAQLQAQPSQEPPPADEVPAATLPSNAPEPAPVVDPSEPAPTPETGTQTPQTEPEQPKEEPKA